MYQLAAVQAVTPLATSSPPIGRSHAPQNESKGPGFDPHLGLPFKTSTRTSLHDYENMRYPVRRRRSNHSSSSRPPSDEFGRLHRYGQKPLKPLKILKIARIAIKTAIFKLYIYFAFQNATLYKNFSDITYTIFTIKYCIFNMFIHLPLFNVENMK